MADKMNEKTVPETEAKDSLSIQVTSRQVFDSPNPGIKMVSFLDKTSATGFSNVSVKADAVSQKGSRFEVSLDAAQSYDVSRPRVNKSGSMSFSHDTMTGQDIHTSHETLLQERSEARAARKEAQAAAEQKTAPEAQQNAKGENCYLNRVHDRMIHPVASKEGMSRVVVKDERSADGYGSALIPTNHIFQSKDRNGIVVPDRKNVNLGPRDSQISYSIKGEDGNFQQMKVSAGELASMYRDEMRQFVKQSREAVKNADIGGPGVAAPQASDEMALD